MAINLGDVNFGVGADMSNLRRSVGELQRFARVVDNAQNAVDGTAAALRRQEKAAGDAFVKVQNLTSAMGRVRGTERYIQAVNSAYEAYTRTVTRGTLSALEFQRAQERLKVSLSNTQNQFRNFTAESRRAEAGAGGLINNLRNLQASAVILTGPLGGLAARISAFTAVTKTAGFAFAAFAAGALAMGAALAKVAMEANRVGAKWKGYQASLTAVTGSTEQGAKELGNLIKVAQDAGVSIGSTAPAFTKFMAAAEGTTLQGAKAEKVFKQFAKASTILNIRADDTAGIFKALEQMISKGTVQAEELRGQLGDRLPGAFQLAARAMGVSTAKLGDLMKKGEVLSEDLLPKLADELTKTFNIPTGPIDTYAAAMGRLQNSYELLMVAIDKKFDITGKVQAAAQAVSEGLDYVRNNLDLLIAQLSIGASAVLSFLAPWAGIPALILSIERFGDALTVVEGEAGSLRDWMVIIWSDIEKVASDAAKNVQESNKGMFDGVAEGLAADGKEIAGYFTAIDEAATTAFNGLMAGIKSVVDVVPLIPQAAVAAMASLWNALVSGADTALNAVLGAIATTVNAVQSLGGLLNTSLIVDTSGWKVDLSGFKSEVSDAGTKLSVAFDEAWQKNKNTKYFENSQKELKTTTDEYIKSVQHRANVEGQLRNDQKNALTEKRAAWQAEKDTNAELERQARLQENLKRIQRYGDEGGGGSGKKKGGKGQSPEKQLDAINAINEAIKRTGEEIDAIQDPDGNLKLLNEEFKRRDEVEKYGDALRKAGVDAEFTKGKTDELYNLLKQRDTLKMAQQGWEEWSNALSKSVDFFGESLVDLAFDGKDAFDDIGKAAKNLAKDLVNTFIQLSLTNPLKNLIFGTNAPTMAAGGSGFGGILGSLLGSLGGGASADPWAGLRLRNGGVSGIGFGDYKKAKNGIVRSPTFFSGSMGNVQAGEAGEEAIMPLSRDGSGALGVRATVPSSGNVTVNVYTPEGSTVSKKQTTNQKGDSIIDIIVEQAKQGVATDIAAGNSAINKSMEGRYGLNSSAGLKK